MVALSLLAAFIVQAPVVARADTVAPAGAIE
jgi:hypothetical protein